MNELIKRTELNGFFFKWQKTHRIIIVRVQKFITKQVNKSNQINAGFTNGDKSNHIDAGINGRFTIGDLLAGIPKLSWSAQQKIV